MYTSTINRENSNLREKKCSTTTLETVTNQQNGNAYKMNLNTAAVYGKASRH